MMMDDNVKLFMENGECIGTLGDFRKAFIEGLNESLSETLELIFEDMKREAYKEVVKTHK